MAADLSVARVTSSDLRRAMGHFASGVTVVTSLTADTAPAGTTASAVASLSLDPPLILVCLDRSSATLAAIHQHGAFVVNVLAAHQQHLSANFARRGTDANWEHVAYRRGGNGCPHLAGVLATVACRADSYLPGGDHEIVVGRVTDIETADHDPAPLLYWRGGYATLDKTQSP